MSQKGLYVFTAQGQTWPSMNFKCIMLREVSQSLRPHWTIWESKTVGMENYSVACRSWEWEEGWPTKWTAERIWGCILIVGAHGTCQNSLNSTPESEFYYM